VWLRRYAKEMAEDEGGKSLRGERGRGTDLRSIQGGKAYIKGTCGLKGMHVLKE